MRLSAKLRMLREQQNMSQLELANRAGVMQGYVSELEAGTKKNPSMDILTKLAGALGVPVTALVANKFELERELVTRLLGVIGWPGGVLTDPKKTYGRETGADVELRLGKHRVGIQATEYHGNEGQAGGALRAQEESDAEKRIIRTYAVPTDASAELTKRFSAKLAKARRYGFEEFSEVWLLIAASLPMPGAIAATAVVPISITTKSLEQLFGAALRASPYRRVFIHVHLPLALYEWSPKQGWRVLRKPEKLTPDGAPGQLWFKRYLDDPELRRDPEGWARREAQRVLEELRSGITSDRDHSRQQKGDVVKKGYVLKTGLPKWSVGCIQNGPKHDAGLRWFVCERGARGDLRAVAYTEEREEAEMIVASLEAEDEE